MKPHFVSQIIDYHLSVDSLTIWVFGIEEGYIFPLIKERDIFDLPHGQSEVREITTGLGQPTFFGEPVEISPSLIRDALRLVG